MGILSQPKLNILNDTLFTTLILDITNVVEIEIQGLYLWRVRFSLKFSVRRSIVKVTIPNSLLRIFSNSVSLSKEYL